MSILENEDFKKQYLGFVKSTDYPVEAQNDPMSRNGVYLVYAEGAQAAEAILQEKHEKEGVELIGWVLRAAGVDHYGEGDGERFRVDRAYRTKEDLLKLFIKAHRKENQK